MSNILNFPGWVIGSMESDHDYRVEAVVPVVETPAICLRCRLMGVTVYRHGTRTQLIMDVPSHGKRMGIDLTLTRWRCGECGGAWMQKVDEIDDERRMTKRLIAYIELHSILRPFLQVADEVGVVCCFRPQRSTPGAGGYRLPPAPRRHGQD